MAAPSERNAIGSLRNFPLFFGTTLFAIEAVGVVSSFSLVKKPKVPLN